jgi:NADH dehydrogenase
MTGTHRVVIIGGGFGGLYAAQALCNAPVPITIIDKRNFHLFQPLLYQVATGGLSPGDIAAPLRASFRRQKNVEILLGEATDVDVANRQVIVNGRQIPYDSLLISTGATHSYFGHPEWEPFAPGLKTIEDATEIRRRLLYAFEAAENATSDEERQQWLTFVIVGAGPTGVELAGALGEIANKTLREEFRRIRPEQARILILDNSPRPLSTFPESLSTKAEQALIQLNVRLRCGVRVTGIDAGGVDLETAGGKDRIASRTVLWAAGVRATPMADVIAKHTGAVQDRSGRIMVAPDLTIPGHPEISIIGDLAHLEQDGVMVPGVAPAAMQMGQYAAARIIAQVRGQAAPAPFRYWNKGNLAVIGRASAVADFGQVRLSGLIAWLAWLFIHLMYIVGFQNRVLVFIQWGFHYFTFNRGARLITGATPPSRPPS